MKRLISVFFAVILVLALAAPVFAAGDDSTSSSTESDDGLSVGVPKPEETATAILQADFEDKVVNGYGKYRAQCAAVVADESAKNSYLKFYNGGSIDLYYHIDANLLGEGNFVEDPEATSNPYYFASDKIIASMRLSRSTAAIADFNFEMKSPGYGDTKAQRAMRLYRVTADGVVITKDGVTLGTVKADKWFEIAVEIDISAETVTYWVNREPVLTEKAPEMLTKVAYFNFSSGNVKAGSEAFVDDLYFGYGELTESFYLIKVDYSMKGVVTPLYYKSDFLLPDDAPYWIGTTENGVKRLIPAGTRITLVPGLTFSGYCPNFGMLEGASIRVDGEHTGLRFQMTADCDYHDELTLYFGRDQVVSGILIVPTDYLEDTEFTHEAILEKYGVLADVVNKRWHPESTSEHYTAYGTLTNLFEGNYGRKFSARAYVKITYEDGSDFIVYGDYDEAKHSRSAYEVAKAAYADTEAGYTEEQMAVITSYMDGVLALKKNGSSVALDDLPAGYTSPFRVGLSSGDSVTVVVTGGDPASILKTVVFEGKPCAFTIEAGLIKVTIPRS